MFRKYLIIFFVSMVPVIELRGAIPYAVAFGLPLLPSYLTAIIGNMVPVPIIFLFARRALEWGKEHENKTLNKIAHHFIGKGEKGKAKLIKRSSRGLYIALFLFVGIPLPGTGAWTGTLAASFLDLDFKKSVIAVMCGVILAGVIMLLISSGVLKTIGL